MLKAILLCILSVVFSPYFYFLGKHWKAEKHADDLIQQHLKNDNGEKKVAIVTGGNTGIGFETCRLLLKAKFNVILACRSKEKASEAIRRLKEELGENIELHFIPLDLSKFDSVKEFVLEFKKRKLPLNLLINNAGIAKVPYKKTVDGFEQTFQVNYLSHFLLTHLLLQELNNTPNSKLINLSSMFHYFDSTCTFDNINDVNQYNDLYQYAKTKAAAVMFAYAFNRHASKQVKAYAVHPGLVYTEIFRYDSLLSTVLGVIGKFIMITPLQGALTTIHVALLNDFKQDEIYFADEMSVDPNYLTKDIQLQDRLWKISKELTCI